MHVQPSGHSPIDEGQELDEVDRAVVTGQARDVARATRLGHTVPGMGRVYEHVTPEMERRVRSVLEGRWVRSVDALTYWERDRLFGLAPIPQEHHRGNSESGLPEEPASKSISQISPRAG
ncbi:hypothetical protein ACFWTE_00030 [Nocardiopsis sp. NPDC058631]|uniref:hypothetical protein n=1 Tax=Nocardiopsis sp. NPDC058631 TaxID=3346566 RepID=UPI003664A336